MSGTIYVILTSYRDLIETNTMKCRYFMHAVHHCAFHIKLFPSLLLYNCYYLGSYLIKIVLLNCTTRGNIKKIFRCSERLHSRHLSLHREMKKVFAISSSMTFFQTEVEYHRIKLFSILQKGLLENDKIIFCVISNKFTIFNTHTFIRAIKTAIVTLVLGRKKWTSHG